MTDPVEQAKADTAFVSGVLKSNATAIDFIAGVSNVLNLWSALERGSVELTRATVRGALWSALVDLPANTFYQQHFASLHPMVGTVVLDLIAAGDLEHGKSAERELMAAFVARQSWATLLLQSCVLLNGGQAAAGFAAQIRVFANSQGFTDYLSEVARMAGPPVEVKAPELRPA